MRYTLPICLAVLLPLLCAIPVTAIVTTRPVEKDGLRLTLSVTQQTFHPWATPRVTWTLTNTGKDTLLIDPWSTAIEVIGRGAKKVIYPGAFYFSRPSCPLLPDQHALFSRETLSDMDGEWHLAPGRYTVRVVYKVTDESLMSPHPPVNMQTSNARLPMVVESGGRIWQGTLTSGELTIFIAPSNPIYTRITDIYQRTPQQADRTCALLALPPEADAVLLQMLRDGNTQAIEALGLRAVREAVPDLIVSASTDARAIIALGQIGDPRATRAVVKQLPYHRHLALRALQALRDRYSELDILPYLKHEEDQTCAEAMAAMQCMKGDPWSVRLLTAYLEPTLPNDYPVEMQNPSTRLILMGDVAVDTVWHAYMDADTKARRLQVATLLGGFLQDGVRVEQIVDWLLSREKVAEPYERQEICRLLRSQYRADVNKFFTRMAEDADPDIRKLAQEILHDRQKDATI